MEFKAQSTLREILRGRPRAAEILEAELGSAIWTELDRPLAEHCRERGVDGESLALSLSSLERPPEGSAWETAPLYELMDLLTWEHRRYRDRDMPDLEARLSETGAEDYPAEFALDEFRLRFHDFKIDFLLHMEEEEAYLFPMALHLEACVRHPELSPESYRGSIGTYFDGMLRTPEAGIKAMLTGLHGMAAFRGGPSTAALDSLHDLLEDFHARVARHADLETGVLMPRAEGMERLIKIRIQDQEPAALGRTRRTP